MFEGYDDAKTSIMGTLLKAIEENKSIANEFKDGFKSLIKRVNWFRVAGTVAKNGIPLALSLTTGIPALPVDSIITEAKTIFGNKDDIQKLEDKVNEFKEEHLNEDVAENIIDNECFNKKNNNKRFSY